MGAEIFSVNHVKEAPSKNFENGYISASEQNLKKLKKFYFLKL